MSIQDIPRLTWSRKVLFLKRLPLTRCFRRYGIHAVRLVEALDCLWLLLAYVIGAIPAPSRALLRITQVGFSWSCQAAILAAAYLTHTSASACRSGSREKIRMMLSLAPLTISPVVEQAATVHRLIAGCVIV